MNMSRLWFTSSLFELALGSLSPDRPLTLVLMAYPGEGGRVNVADI